MSTCHIQLRNNKHHYQKNKQQSPFQLRGRNLENNVRYMRLTCPLRHITTKNFQISATKANASQLIAIKQKQPQLSTTLHNVYLVR